MIFVLASVIKQFVRERREKQREDEYYDQLAKEGMEYNQFLIDKAEEELENNPEN